MKPHSTVTEIVRDNKGRFSIPESSIASKLFSIVQPDWTNRKAQSEYEKEYGETVRLSTIERYMSSYRRQMEAFEKQGKIEEEYASDAFTEIATMLGFFIVILSIVFLFFGKW